MARRWWARTAVRTAALVALLIAGMGGIGAAGGASQMNAQMSALMNQLSQLGGAAGGGSSSSFSSSTNTFISLGVGIALQMLIPLGVAATLIWFERRIVRWLVPIPSHRCPRCDYSLIGVHEPRCPECGLPLDEGVTGKEDPDAAVLASLVRRSTPSAASSTPMPGPSPASTPAFTPATPPSPAPRRRETRPSDPE